MPKKVLIVYENMGMGHLRMAKIVENILGSETDVTIINQAGSELFEVNDVKLVNNLWNFCLRKNWIQFTNIVINFLLRLTIMPTSEVAEITSIHQKLDEVNPDIIISTADVWNHVLGSYAFEQKIPFFTIITEISVFMDLLNPHATHLCYFHETTYTIRSFDMESSYFSIILSRYMKLSQKLSYIFKYYNDYILHAFKNPIYRNINQKFLDKNRVQVEVIGPIAEKKHFLKKNPRELRNMLGLSIDTPTVLILSGSIGGQILFKIIKNICKNIEEPLNIIAICGNDQMMYQKIQAFSSRAQIVKIIPYKFVDNLEDYMTCSDCIIARPSAGIFIESLLHRVPLITYGKVTSNDHGTLEIINKYRTGEICIDRKDLVPTLQKVLSHNEEYQKKIDRLLANYRSTYEAQEKILKEIILQKKVSFMVDTGSIGDQFLEEVIV